MLWLLLVVAVLYLIYKKVTSSYTYWKELGVKCWEPTFFFGDAWRPTIGAESFNDLIKRQYDDFKNERFYGGYTMMTPNFFVRDPDLLKQMLIKDFDHFTDHFSFIPEGYDSLWHKTLPFLKGENWRQVRATLSPTFTSSKMKSMFKLVVECAEKFTAHFEGGSALQEVELRDASSRYANDVIATCAFGVQCDSLKHKGNDFYKMGKQVTDFGGFLITIKLMCITVFPKFFNMMGLELQPERVMNYFKGLVSETVTTREQNGIVRHDMLHLLMEVMKGRLKNDEQEPVESNFAVAQETDLPKSTKPNLNITMEDVQAQAFIFFFAGFDTVSTLLSFAGYELGINTDIQERLRGEIDDAMDECGGKLTYEVVHRMKYLDQVISEALRKWPPVTATDRICTTPYTLPTNPGEPKVTLKPDDQVFIPVFGLHRDPDYFPDPERFDPERFSDENKANIKPYSYLPFGLGPRSCIGLRFALMEIKVLFIHLLHKFELVPIARTQIPLKLSKTGLNMNAEDGFWVGLKPRS